MLSNIASVLIVYDTID